MKGYHRKLYADMINELVPDEDVVQKTAQEETVHTALGVFDDYQEAYDAALNVANQYGQKVLLRKMDEYGKTRYALSFASGIDSSMAGEAVEPGGIKTALYGVDLGDCYNCKFFGRGANIYDDPKLAESCQNPESTYLGSIPSTLRCSLYQQGADTMMAEGRQSLKTAQELDDYELSEQGREQIRRLGYDQGYQFADEYGADLNPNDVLEKYVDTGYPETFDELLAESLVDAGGDEYQEAMEIFDNEFVRGVMESRAKRASKTAAEDAEHMYATTCPECGADAPWSGNRDWYECPQCGTHFDPKLDATISPETVQDIEESRPSWVPGSPWASKKAYKTMKQHGDTDTWDVFGDNGELLMSEESYQVASNFVGGPAGEWSETDEIDMKPPNRNQQDAFGSKIAVQATPELVEQARQLGEQAFLAGKPSNPGVCPELMAMLEGNQVGEGLPLLDAWDEGWHGANVAADVSGWTGEENQALRDARGKTAAEGESFDEENGFLLGEFRECEKCHEDKPCEVIDLPIGGHAWYCHECAEREGILPT